MVSAPLLVNLLAPVVKLPLLARVRFPVLLARLARAFEVPDSIVPPSRVSEVALVAMLTPLATVRLPPRTNVPLAKGEPLICARVPLTVNVLPLPTLSVPVLLKLLLVVKVASLARVKLPLFVARAARALV